MTNWALVIGINEYQRLRSLNYAVQDAEAVRDFLREEAGFEHVFYFSDNSPDEIAPDGSPQSTRPTYANLWSFLLDFFEEPYLKAGDNFWFFFSGHGVRYRERDFLMPCDTNSRAIENTAISINYVTERLRRCGADNIVLFLDACRNQRDRAGVGIGLEKHQGVITISSCSPKEVAYEIEEIGQGSFTYALLESLRIKGEGNCATVERLYQRLRHRVPAINNYYNKPQQIPYAVVEPATKYHFILLPRYATLKDIETLKIDAFRAETENNYELAKQLWIQVNVAAAGSDLEAIEAIQRLAEWKVRATNPPQFTVSAQLTKPWRFKLPIIAISICGLAVISVLAIKKVLQDTSILSKQQLPLNGKVINGLLNENDSSGIPLDKTYSDAYIFKGIRGQSVTIEMSSQEFDPYLVLLNPNHSELDSNDDVSPKDWNAKIVVELPKDGYYTVIARSSVEGESGAYKLKAILKRKIP
ncbi:MAG: hypothetical protein F6J96_35275 [Symploca sp. SIO1C2]|nr:hypothetical protein [Symploca sp. SIO1C2]